VRRAPLKPTIHGQNAFPGAAAFFVLVTPVAGVSWGCTGRSGHRTVMASATTMPIETSKRRRPAAATAVHDGCARTGLFNQIRASVVTEASFTGSLRNCVHETQLLVRSMLEFLIY